MEQSIERAMGGQVRNRILAEHAVLRTELDQLEALLEAHGRNEPDLGLRLRRRCLVFFDAFSSHLDVEDVVLVGALRTLEDGERMARRLTREHREQRMVIDWLIEQIAADAAGPTAALAGQLRAFAQSVRIDMEHEEVTILREGLLVED